MKPVLLQAKPTEIRAFFMFFRFSRKDYRKLTYKILAAWNEIIFFIQTTTFF